LLRIKRTLDGAEIDRLISDLQARKALAVEHRRRADWQKRESSANTFELGSIAPLTRRCHSPKISVARSRVVLGLADVPNLYDPRAPGATALGAFLSPSIQIDRRLGLPDQT
jgi:hypothetical protein